MKVILVFFMVFLMSVSSEDAFKLFCSEKNFSFINQYYDKNDHGHRIYFVKELNETNFQYWNFKYNESYGLYNISTWVSHSIPWSEKVGIYWKEVFRTFHPCNENVTVVSYSDKIGASYCKITFKKCQKYKEKRRDKNIETRGVRFLGLFWLDSNPEELYLVGQNISESTLMIAHKIKWFIVSQMTRIGCIQSTKL